ncbi:MAG: putative membrane protein YqgA involved in biofilm formation [Flavobacteriales bacterium]|jgi:uncharacterized membrane protein YqgA involved in biofilm formation
MLGTLINALTITIGSFLGMGLNQKMPEKYIKIVFQALGLFTLFVGIESALQTRNMLILVLGLITGAIIGEALGIETKVNKFAEKLKTKTGSKDERFATGFTTAFMLFCVGTMTVLGCFKEGMDGDRKIIITKAVMDFFSSAALASAFGKGVLFSVIPLLVYQGGLTYAAMLMGDFLSTAMKAELTAVGGLMLIGLGITILELRKLEIINMLPALVTTVLLTYVAEYFNIYSF